MKIEVVITVWDDHGDFKYRERIEGEDPDKLVQNTRCFINESIGKLKAEEESRKKQWEDDDIPF